MKLLPLVPRSTARFTAASTSGTSCHSSRRTGPELVRCVASSATLGSARNGAAWAGSSRPRGGRWSSYPPRAGRRSARPGTPLGPRPSVHRPGVAHTSGRFTHLLVVVSHVAGRPPAHDEVDSANVVTCGRSILATCRRQPGPLCANGGPICRSAPREPLDVPLGAAAEQASSHAHPPDPAGHNEPRDEDHLAAGGHLRRRQPMSLIGALYIRGARSASIAVT